MFRLDGGLEAARAVGLSSWPPLLTKNGPPLDLLLKIGIGGRCGAVFATKLKKKLHRTVILD
jgi:hypothetical protein